MLYGFVMVSANSKTGPIPITISSKDTCPKSCPLKKENGGGCYASSGRVNIAWTRLNTEGLKFNQLLEKIKSIPNGRIFRHNVAGDLTHKDEAIDRKKLNQLVEASKGKRGFCYTHHNPSLKSNRDAIKKSNKAGFTINLSADNLSEADKFKGYNVAPVVVLLPSDQKTNTITPKGNKVIVCPNYTHNVQCMDCGLCQKADRSVIVGFPAHGISFKKVNQIQLNNA